MEIVFGQEAEKLYYKFKRRREPPDGMYDYNIKNGFCVINKKTYDVIFFKKLTRDTIMITASKEELKELIDNFYLQVCKCPQLSKVNLGDLKELSGMVDKLYNGYLINETK